MVTSGRHDPSGPRGPARGSSLSPYGATSRLVTLPKQERAVEFEVTLQPKTHLCLLCLGILYPVRRVVQLDDDSGEPVAFGLEVYDAPLSLALVATSGLSNLIGRHGQVADERASNELTPRAICEANRHVRFN